MRRAALSFSLFFGLLVGLLSGLMPLAAEGAPKIFDLPAQSAASALLAFSRQADVEMIFSFDELRQVRSTAVIGTYEPIAALGMLLRGSGFVARRDDRGKFVVAPMMPPPGSIEGRLLNSDGSSARGLRVALLEARQTVMSDENGEYTFPAVPRGTYELVVSGRGFQTLRIEEVRVEPSRVVMLAPRTVAPAGELVRLDAVVVEGQSDRGGRAAGGVAAGDAHAAAQNLDLTRTEDDALPYTIFTRDQIVRSGVVNLNEFLQRELLDSSAETRDPAVQTSSTSGSQGIIQSAFSGSTNLNLRGYGTDETVVLVNGRRLPVVLTTFNNANPTFNAPDVSFIPLSLVQQVEVLPLSASALYSGNPVGGVINIVLRSNADANSTEVTSTYTNALRPFDAPESSLSVLHVQTLLGGALHLRLNANLTQSLPPTEAELRYHQTHQGAPPGFGAAIFRATPNVSSIALVTGVLPSLFGPGSSPVTSVAPGADGTQGLGAFAGRQGIRDFDFFQAPGGMATSVDSLNYPYGERERRSVFYGSADYEVCPWLQIGVDGGYSLTVVNSGYSVLRGDQLTLPATSRFNPFQQDVAVSLNETAPLLGEGYDEARVEYGSAVLGVIVELPGHWRVSLDTQYAASLAKYRGVTGADPVRWQQLVDQGIYNPLRDTQVFGPPAQFYDQVLEYQGGRGRFATLGNYETLEVAVRVTNDQLALPTGAGTLNFGGDYERDHFGNLSERQVYGDGSDAVTPAVFTGRTLKAYSFFGELQAPLLPPARLPAWLRRAVTDLGLRFDAGANARESNFAPTAGLKLDSAAGLSCRGSVTLSSRFPPPQLAQQRSVGTSAGGAAANLTGIIDPLRGNQLYAVPAADQLNPVLQSEKAFTKTAGLIYQRGTAHHLRASIDFVDTIKNNEVVDLDAQSVMDLEPLLPGRVQRAPLAPGDLAAAGSVTSILTGAANLYLRHSQDWEASLDYSWTPFAGGALDVYGRVVYFVRYERQVLSGSPSVDELRNPDGSAPDLLRFRGNFGAGWSNRAFGFGWDGHFFEARILPKNEWQYQGSDRIDPFWQLDAYVHADLGRWLPWKGRPSDLRVQARVNNVFGWSYPFYDLAPSGPGVQPYGDWRGRTYSLSFTAGF